MSRSSRGRGRQSPVGGAGPISLRANGPSDVVCMVPYLLGFVPDDALVVIALTGKPQRLGTTMRVDLVEAAAAGDLAEAVVAHAWRQRFPAVFVAAFSDDPARADPVVDAVVAAFGDLRVEVVDAVRADGRRWWSYTCQGSCCPAGGTAYDPRSSVVSAHAVAAGMAPAVSREALRSSFEPAPDGLRAAVDAARAAVMSRAVFGAADFAPVEVSAVLDAATAAVGARAGASGDGPRSATLEVATLGRLLAMVQSARTRDLVWASFDRESAAVDFEIWSQVTRAARDRWLPPAGFLAGFAAWLTGSGVLASHAIDRVRSVMPDYPPVELLARALTVGLDPAEWERQPSLRL